MGQQQGLTAHAGSRQCGFRTGMTAADDDHVKAVRVIHVGTSGYHETWMKRCSHGGESGKSARHDDDWILWMNPGLTNVMAKTRRRRRHEFDPMGSLQANRMTFGPPQVIEPPVGKRQEFSTVPWQDVPCSGLADVSLRASITTVRRARVECVWRRGFSRGLGRIALAFVIPNTSGSELPRTRSFGVSTTSFGFSRLHRDYMRERKEKGVLLML